MTRLIARKPTLKLAMLAVLLVQLTPVLQNVPQAAEAISETAQPPAELPQPLPGQLSSKYRIDRANPEASVPGPKERDANPLEYGYLIQDLLTEAENAKQKHDYKAVVLFYRAVAKAVPDNAKGWSKLCEAYEVVNDRDRAIRACKYALERPAVELQDYIRYVRLILSKPGDITAEERSAIQEVLVHLDKQPSIEATAAQIKCEAGVRQKDVALLEACTQTLAKLAPEDPKTIVFQWNLALQKGQQSDARRLVERAKKAGVVMANIERMEKVTESSRRAWPRVLGIVAAALFGIGALMWHLRRRRMTPHRLAR
ncbi:MAG: hypothetical protein H7X95_14380 [Deltaproteobacteria bacterium]|nr:hypothetical protein [Deltaproteobacteria bacterium]